MAPSERPEILIADDDETMRDMIAETLRMDGYAPIAMGTPDAPFELFRPKN